MPRSDPPESWTGRHGSCEGAPGVAGVRSGRRRLGRRVGYVLVDDGQRCDCAQRQRGPHPERHDRAAGRSGLSRWRLHPRRGLLGRGSPARHLPAAGAGGLLMAARSAEKRVRLSSAPGRRAPRPGPRLAPERISPLGVYDRITR